MALPTGTRLGPYEILEPLGAGGMGEVYRARDPKLSREVAVKVLPPELASEPERRERFEREARTLAALNHPHIVTIFSVEETDGLHFLTMELAEGKTLAEVIPRSGLPLSRLLRIAIPLTEAVSAAHEKGITHRDLKPGNVMVDEGDRVKVLDFGLAKLQEQEEATDLSQAPTWPATEAGRVLGTAPYMSPEQVQGKPVDHRSDVFSLGVLLYEMAAGARPFSGESAADLASSILRDTPVPVTERKPEMPRDLGKLIGRCLEKEPKKRFQSTLDLANDLEELKREVDSGEAVSAGRDRRSGAPAGWKKWLWAVAALLGVGLGAVSWLRFSPSETPGPPPRPVPLTAFEGLEQDPALSPDGNQVAFVWDGGSDGHYHVYVKLIGGGEPLQLTSAPADDFSPAWSPGGGEIAFLREAEGGHDVLSVSALGGPERRLASTIVTPHAVYGHAATHGLDWSPDGRFLTMVDGGSAGERGGIFLLSSETGEKQRLTTPLPPYVIDSHPTFSPDGTRVAFVRRWPTALASIGVQPVDGGETLGLLTSDDSTDQWHVWDVDWTQDGAALVFTSSFGMASSGLWRVSATGGEPSRLSFGAKASEVSVAASGGRLAYSDRLEDPNIWRVGGPVSKEPGSPTRLIASTRRDAGPEYSPDGRRIAFESERSGRTAVWVCGSEGQSCRQLTYGDYAGAPTWSPSGTRIAFYQRHESRSKPTWDIFTVDANGGFSRAATQDGFLNAWPRWSASGRWMYFWSDRAGGRQVFKVSTDEGQVVQLTRKGGWAPFEDGGGRFVYYAKEDPLEGIWRVPVDGGEETPVLQKRVSSALWCLWRDKIVYVDEQDGSGPSIDLFDPATGETRELASLGPNTQLSWGLTVSPDGRWVLFPKTDVKSDIMLVEDFR